MSAGGRGRGEWGGGGGCKVSFGALEGEGCFVKGVSKYWKGEGFLRSVEECWRDDVFCHRRPLSTGGKDLQFLL